MFEFFREGHVPMCAKNVEPRCRTSFNDAGGVDPVEEDTVEEEAEPLF